MNNSISVGTPSAQMSSVNGANGVGRLADSAGGYDALQAAPDWFSAQTLDNGQTIQAVGFDSSQSIASVDDAAKQIFSRLFPA